MDIKLVTQLQEDIFKKASDKDQLNREQTLADLRKAREAKEARVKGLLVKVAKEYNEETNRFLGIPSDSRVWPESAEQAALIMNAIHEVFPALRKTRIAKFIPATTPEGTPFGQVPAKLKLASDNIAATFFLYPYALWIHDADRMILGVTLENLNVPDEDFIKESFTSSARRVVASLHHLRIGDKKTSPSVQLDLKLVGPQKFAVNRKETQTASFSQLQRIVQKMVHGPLARKPKASIINQYVATVDRTRICSFCSGEILKGEKFVLLPGGYHQSDNRICPECAKMLSDKVQGEKK